MTGSNRGLDSRYTTTGRVSNPPLPSHSLVTLQYYDVEPIVLLPFMLLLPFMARLYSRLWPDTPAEVMSRAAHIHSRRYGDINTALHLVALEQRRVFPACHRIWMPCVCGAK